MKELEIAKSVFEAEIDALKNIKDSLDSTFVNILNLIIQCKGKVIVTGMGKSGHIARKISATMASLGVSSFFLHPGEAMHGDLGMVGKDDLVIAISHSGESDEIKKIIPSIKIIGASLVGMTSNPDSTLARECDETQIFANIKEACHLGLAPTTSTTTVLVYGDALAVAASQAKKFGMKDFGVFHPAGSLGKKLTIRSVDLMKRIKSIDTLTVNSNLKDALVVLSRTGTEILAIKDEMGRLCGVVTNGDIERCLEKGLDVYNEGIGSLVNRFPVYVNDDSMAIDALGVMVENNIKALFVVKNDKVVGIIEKQVIVDSGIYV
ncbi:MAG: KpsF/GutQ family sugar-phosphate isomerase [Lachnospiraceae bacterium]|nr:KpsF/GutQ family sugar-phosphate isomerase [Lachnospiraceae bacterium]